MGANDRKRRGFTGLGARAGRGGRKRETDVAARTGRYASATVAVVAVLFAASLFVNSGYVKRNFAAVTIGDVKYSVTDFNYYYQNVYMQYYNTMSGTGELSSAMLPDTKKSLESQVYDEETGETWAKFFERMALEQMKSDNRIYVEALKAGYQLPEEDKNKMEEEVANAKNMAYAYGYKDLDTYLRTVYGRGMDESAFRRILERTYVVSSYTNHVRDSFTYTPEELEAYYSENSGNLDTFTYRYFLVEADEVKREDYSDDSQYQAAKDAAIAKAVERAEGYAARITDEQSFIEVAREYDPKTYHDDDASKRVYQGELLGSTYGDWMKDPARRTGDVGTFKTTTGCYVVFFISRSDNHYMTKNVRQILVKPEQIDKADYSKDEDATAYEQAVENARRTAEETADKINNEWLAAGATEEKLEELTSTYSDQISKDDSTYLENVHIGQLPEEVESWLFDPQRKPGDHALIYSKSTGYHIVYYAGEGKKYSDILADKKKRDKDLQAWKDSLPVVEPKTTWLMALTK